MTRYRRCFLLLIAFSGIGRAADCAALAEARSYIHEGWKTLTRSNASLTDSARDSKVAQAGPVTLWVAADEDAARIAGALQVNVRRLSNPPSATQESWLLYLPGPYVAPGSRFNEMYGWDSYFILLGLLRDAQPALAQSMTDNFLYEVLDVYRGTGDTAWLQRSLPALESYYEYWTNPPHLTPETGLSRYDGGSDQT